MAKLRSAIWTLAMIGCSNVSHAAPYEDYVKAPTPESAFGFIHQVTTHQRCVNCHGVINEGVQRPMVGENSRLHPMNISVVNNLRLQVQNSKFVEIPNSSQPVNCRSCHQNSNGQAPGMPPGAANDLMPGFVWHMPPPTMILSRNMTAQQLCEQLLDPKQNSFLAFRGGRDDMETFKKEFVHHVSDDPLVIWAWQPGPGRIAAPGTHPDLVKAMKLWIDAGAPCPQSSEHKL